MIVPIVLYGSSVLRKHATVVTPEENFHRIADSLSETLKKSNGIGLAAPQINILKRIFIIDTTRLSEKDAGPIKFEGIFINPEIIDRSIEQVIYQEGCLSFPDIFEEVKRSEKIVVRYHDLLFNLHEETFNGLIARVFLHEYDHLEGILFIDKINPLRRRMLSGRLRQIERMSENKKGIKTI